MIRAWWERRKQLRRLNAEEREDEYRRQDVEDAARAMMQCATPLEALEAARLVVTGASTSFGLGDSDKKALYVQIGDILGKLERKLEE